MKELRILHVSSPSSWRGGEQQLGYLILELQRQGVYQKVICKAGSQMADFCKTHQVPYLAYRLRHAFDLSFCKQIKELVTSENIQILHPHDSHAHSLSVWASLLYRLPIRIVLHRRVDFKLRRSPISQFKYNYSKIQRIICVSTEVQRLVKAGIRQPEKAVVVHSGVDLEKFPSLATNALREEFRLDPKLKIIGNVAAITQQKDYFTFVDTASLLLQKNSDLHFFVVGTGDQEELIKEKVKTMQLEGHFTFTGFRTDINKLLPSLDLLLFTSEMEGLGTTILDAFTAKVPVVASRVGGIPELVESGVTGYLASPKNATEFAEKVQLVLKDQRISEKLVENAFEKVQSFSKEITAQKIMAIYHEVLD